MNKKIIYGIFVFILATSPALFGFFEINKPIYDHVVPKPKNVLRVLTFNVEGEAKLSKIKNPQSNINAIKDVNADLVVLTESSLFWEKKCIAALTHEYPYHQFQHYPRPGADLGVFSKYPFKTKWYVHSGVGFNPNWLFFVDTPHGKIQVLGIHLIPPSDEEDDIGFLGNSYFDSQWKRLQEVKFYYQSLNHQLPTLIVGDFNEGDLSRAGKFLRQVHFKDAMLQTNFRGNTWHWMAGAFLLTDRLDRIYYTQQLQLLGLYVLNAGESDHYPTYADFLIK